MGQNSTVSVEISQPFSSTVSVKRDVRFIPHLFVATVRWILPRCYGMPYFTLSTADLVGKLGTTRYKITRDTGSVDVRDESGSLNTVMCIVDDDTSPIEGRVEVVLWKYEPDRNVFYVTPFNEVENRLRSNCIEEYSQWISHRVMCRSS